MSAISDNLIHFLARSIKEYPLGQLEVCKLIIENGLKTSKIIIKFPDGASIFNQTICFTDIPLNECGEHTSIYGKFGIGFKKSFIKNSGGNPARYFVDYVPGKKICGGYESRGILSSNLWTSFKFTQKFHQILQSTGKFSLFDKSGKEFLSEEEISNFVASQIQLYSFDKEMGDLGPARDDTDGTDSYYKEREWRLVPHNAEMSTGIAVSDDNGQSHSYKFRRSDVNMIVVPNEEVRKAALEYFISLKNSSDERLAEFGKNPLPILNYDDLLKW